jgi:hypothetical protein
MSGRVFGSSADDTDDNGELIESSEMRIVCSQMEQDLESGKCPPKDPAEVEVAARQMSTNCTPCLSISLSERGSPLDPAANIVRDNMLNYD